MTSTTSSSDIDYFKIIATAGSAAAIDMFIFGESNINNTGVIAVSAAGGAWIGSMVGTSLPDLSESLPVFLGNGNGLMQRAIEIGSGVGAGYDVNVRAEGVVGQAVLPGQVPAQTKGATLKMSYFLHN